MSCCISRSSGLAYVEEAAAPSADVPRLRARHKHSFGTLLEVSHDEGLLSLLPTIGGWGERIRFVLNLKEDILRTMMMFGIQGPPQKGRKQVPAPEV